MDKNDRTTKRPTKRQEPLSRQSAFQARPFAPRDSSAAASDGSQATRAHLFDQYMQRQQRLANSSTSATEALAGSLRASPAVPASNGAGVLQRTIYDDEIGTVVWTEDFEAKHLALDLDEAARKGMSRLQTAARKDSGARPTSNTVIIYDKDMLFYLKEQVLSGATTSYLRFSLGVNIGLSALQLLTDGTATLEVQDGMINHLADVDATVAKEQPYKSRVTQL